MEFHQLRSGRSYSGEERNVQHCIWIRSRAVTWQHACEFLSKLIFWNLMADHTQIFCIDVFCMLELRISSWKERKKGGKRLSLVFLFVTIFIFAHTSCTLHSASDILSLQMPHSRLSTVGSRTYCVFGPSAWNDLPLPLWQKRLIQISSKNFFPQKL